MVAQPQSATCPACGGSGQQEIEFTRDIFNLSARLRKRTRSCLACRATGQVEAYRVCLACGRFREACICTIGHRNTEIRKVVKIMQKPESAADRIVVDWVKRNAAWAVYALFRGKDRVYLGQFKDEDLAQQMAREAEYFTPDQYDGLREKYRELRKAQRQADVPAIAEEPTKQNALSILLDLVQQALQADARMHELQNAANEACKESATAEQIAIEAWNRVIEALHELGGDESAFNRSAFGSILLEMQRD
jgi:hypothetical protein